MRTQRVLVPKELCHLKPFPAPEVVLLAAFHVSGLVLGLHASPAGILQLSLLRSPGLPSFVLQAFLTRTNNQEVTSIALQPSSALRPRLQDAGAGQLLVVPCPPSLDSAATITSHASVINTAVLSASWSAAAPYQAAVALDMESAAAAASASSLGVAAASVAAAQQPRRWQRPGGRAGAQAGLPCSRGSQVDG
jgi:hypothetical protein